MTLDEFNKKMTLYYSKETGEIKSYCLGPQTMDYFNVNKEEFSKIWDYKVFDRDDYVINNKEKFVVDLETNQLKIKQDALPKYPVA
ncbi:hypothetical protein CSC2_17540 [Clostridium zeae]|uniref:Uncharacterized protein n=1 Tax=Clostridium zeae TaxID=2759022 RepID=A0ABQ1E910_9CLOT|nr:hypothetical protein [Clostridium zeae]GFZ31228.1 hypothetical protein CSC2_17540 [Clostridium zeae]